MKPIMPMPPCIEASVPCSAAMALLSSACQSVSSSPAMFFALAHKRASMRAICIDMARNTRQAPMVTAQERSADLSEQRHAQVIFADTARFSVPREVISTTHSFAACTSATVSEWLILNVCPSKVLSLMHNFAACTTSQCSSL